MIIINIVDIHGNANPIDELGDVLSSADLVLIGGDITHFGSDTQAKDIIEKIKEYNQNILAVTGNCDNKEVDDYLYNENIQLHGRAVNIDGVCVFGAGGSLPCPSPTPNIYSESDYAGILENAVSTTNENSPTVMVCHQPPVDTINDTVTNGAHVGSKSVRAFIEKYQPLVCFTGHIHEAPGIDEIGSTKIVNPGPLGTRSYALLDVGDKIKSLEIKKF